MDVVVRNTYSIIVNRVDLSMFILEYEIMGVRRKEVH